MFGLKKKAAPKVYETDKSAYKQVAVRPSTHAKLIEIADKRNRTIIDIAQELVGA